MPGGTVRTAHSFKPKLVAAYGIRVSEIIQSPMLTLKARTIMGISKTSSVRTAPLYGPLPCPVYLRWEYIF
jgi:hypothetical protein